MALYYDEILSGNGFDQTNLTMSSSNGTTVIDKKQSSALSEQYGYSIEELFHIARQFLKDKQGSKEIQLKYHDNVRFIALSKQIKIGNWDASYTPNVGFLDVVGNDRKQAWIALGDMSKEKAMEEYMKLLLDRCPTFRDYLEAQDMKNEEKDRLRQEDETRQTLEQEAERTRQYELEQISRLEEQKKKREEFQRKQIQDSLNLQTYSQFKAYAEQQYSGNKEAQDELIRQLQEQHFQQYMQQVYQQQLLQQQQQQTRIKANMEQQQLENVVSPVVQSTTPTNVVLPSMPTNIVPLPSPTNAVPQPILFNPSVPLTSISQMPPLGPAPTQLPPVAHPPPIAPPQSVINSTATIQEIKVEPIIPIQAQFETLSVNTPLEPLHFVLPLSVGGNLTQQQFSSVQINNELNMTQELVDGNPIAPLPIDGNATLNLTGEASLIPEDAKPESPNITPANMWTRKDVKEFKEQIRKEKDAVIKIGSGETVTVRVPTHEDGRCIFWEFATDYYDIGFGLYFEWSKAPSNTVTVHVSDSSEEEEEGGEDGGNPEKKDIEKGVGSTNKPPKPPQDEIVPIYRRDCHDEVYAGSHPYPGNGVYLLKFDNSYSLWRSKTLYYRVYYSK